jgi:drug/metabolite transporter (DMT)-like permease
MIADDLNTQISDASALVALLLVFVFAYFAALLPIWEDIRQEARPPADDDRAALRQRVSTYRVLGLALLAIIALVFLILGPLTLHVLHSELWNPFQTLRMALLLVDLLLLGTAVGVVAEIVLLSKKRTALM